MSGLGIDTSVADRATRDRAARWLGRRGVRLPRFAELADPLQIAVQGRAPPASVDPDQPEPANLFRMHWQNDLTRRGLASTPLHLVFRSALTGVKPPIAAALGCYFPLIGAHKVLAAYGCMVPRLVTGRFDPERDKAVWPSTGNYCRGGIAISRILGSRGVAVLPQGMSAERFSWLTRWVGRSEDIVRTPGSESNVKEIYDACAVMARAPATVVLNQFSEFGNYLAHWTCTGPALGRLVDALRAQQPGLRPAAFVAASGSAGTVAAGDWLKQHYGAKIVAVEASECPTMLRNGFGEHRIQGIGDKHVPLIHNVMNGDVVVGVSDISPSALDLLFNSEAGLAYLTSRRRVEPQSACKLKLLGLSGIANLVAAIKLAKRLDLGEDDLIVTVATDSAALYASERTKWLATRYPQGFDEVSAGEVFGQHLAGIADNDVLELTHHDRSRIFNLGYYTWVEQQGVPADAFDARRRQAFWIRLREALPALDALIAEFNAKAGFAGV
jgi:cysteine synthase